MGPYLRMFFCFREGPTYLNGVFAQKIPPSVLPNFFKTSLEAPLLLSIVEVFSLAVSSTGEPAIKKRVQEYLNNFPRIPRFNTVTMFMNKEEKGLCKLLIDNVGDVSGWRI